MCPAASVIGVSGRNWALSAVNVTTAPGIALPLASLTSNTRGTAAGIPTTPRCPVPSTKPVFSGEGSGLDAGLCGGCVVAGGVAVDAADVGAGAAGIGAGATAGAVACGDGFRT